MKYIKIYGPDDRYIHTMREEDGVIVNEEDIPDDSEIIDNKYLNEI